MQTIKWRKQTSFWDELEVPADQLGPHLFTWLESVTPHPHEHDFILYTDGSGCTKGWGASASVIEKIDLLRDEERRGVVDRHVLVSATYGSTVQRREFEAFLNGLHEIMRLSIADFLDQGKEEFGNPDPNNLLMNFTGTHRVSILWYTDRANLAKSLLFDEQGDVLNARSSERDLWMRYSLLAKHICVTPMHVTRNIIDNQRVCDSLCTAARAALKDCQALTEITEHIYPEEKWKLNQPQRALF